MAPTNRKAREKGPSLGWKAQAIKESEMAIFDF
jgi:hypothetical protein